MMAVQYESVENQAKSNQAAADILTRLLTEGKLVQLENGDVQLAN